jgi:hypothetical protein
LAIVNTTKVAYGSKLASLLRNNAKMPFTKRTRTIMNLFRLFRKPNELPAIHYDALKASADEYGGIGAGDVCDQNHNPNCLFGHAVNIESLRGNWHGNVLNNPIAIALKAAGVSILDGDSAVYKINIRKGKRKRFSNEYNSPRVSFDELTKELRLVRGK